MVWFETKQKKTTTTKNTGKIKALCDFFFFPLSCWGFFRLSFIFFPFQRRVYFCCVLKTFVQCEAVTWLPGWGGVSKPNELLYKPGSAWRLATCLGELSQGAAIFWEESFLLSPFLSPSTFQWEPFSHSTYFWLTQISSKTWVMPKMGYSYSFTRLYASLLS